MFAVIEISVQKEYEKNPDIKSDDIRMIREWMTTQPHLPHKHITDLDIILAYHSCGSDIDLTKKLIDRNLSLRTFCLFYKNRNIDKPLQDALDTWLIAPLKTPTPKGYRAIYCQLLDPDTVEFVYRDVVRAFVMVMDLWQLEEGTAPGVVVVLNMEKVALGHLYQIDLTVAQQFFYFLQEGMFVRLKEFHFINAPSLIDRLLFMVKPFMKEDLLRKLVVHTVGSNTWDEYIDRIDFLKEVSELTAQENRGTMWIKLKQNSKWFEDESRKRADESKRIDKSSTVDNIFNGVETTFRSLQID